MKLLFNPESNIRFDLMYDDLVGPLREVISERNYGDSVTTFMASFRIMTDDYLREFTRPGGITRYSPKHRTLIVVRNIDYETFGLGSPEVRMKLVADCIRRIFAESDQTRLKPKEYDKDRLCADVEAFLQSRGL
ncbi:MAG TPA: hypothetical protein VHC20_00015 [Candidatus Paceibacterota bacterium]|nr:hypothetical protein [Candidatus Paceibacterota bacterium]